MQKYQNSKVRKISVIKEKQKEYLTAQIVPNPAENLTLKEKDKLYKDVDNLIQDSWGKFTKEYISESVFKSYLLCLIYNGQGDLIALAPLKKLKIQNDDVYSFGLSAVEPEYRNLSLLKKMGYMLGKRVILENIIRFKFKIEVIFITPNIRTLGTISRIADFIYPNPYSADKNGKINEADDETWVRIQEFLEVSNEKYRKLEREGSIMEGFYDDKEKLQYKKKVDHSDKALDKFGEKYLYVVPGREFVVRAIVGLKGLMNVNKNN